MKSKKYIALMLLGCTYSLNGMDALLQLSQSISKELPKEIGLIIRDCILPIRHWWYCDQEFDIKNHSRIEISSSFNSSGDCLAIERFDDGVVRVSNIKTQEETALFKHHKKAISACLNNKGNLLAISSGKTAYLVDMQGKREIVSFKHDRRVDTVCLNGPGDILATSSEYIVYIFNTLTKKEIASFPDDYIPAICLNGQGDVITIGSKDGQVTIFKVMTKEKIASFNLDQEIQLVSLSEDGYILAAVSGLFNRKIHIFNVKTKEKIASLKKEKQHFVLSVCLSGAGNSLSILLHDDICNRSISRIFRRHDSYTFEQLQVKKLLWTWLLIEKPDKKKITTLEILLADVVKKCGLNHATIFIIWNSFPKNMQSAIWRTMLYKIKRYGKTDDSWNGLLA